MKVSCKVIDDLFSVKGEKGSYDIELKIVSWNYRKPKFDLRRWKNDQHLNGFTLEDSELRGLYERLKEYYEPEVDEDEYDDSEDDETTIEEQIIDFRQFIVIDSISSCIRKNHSLYKVKAKVPIYRSFKDEVVLVEAADTYYCEDCEAYYIEEAAFEGLKAIGPIMCAVFNKDTFDEFVKNGRKFSQDDLATESKLKIIGYNVQNGGPNEKERRKILEYAYLSGYMSKERIASFLKWLIKTHENRPNMQAAVSKWKSDRKWVLGIKRSDTIPIGIKAIITKD